MKYNLFSEAEPSEPMFTSPLPRTDQTGRFWFEADPNADSTGVMKDYFSTDHTGQSNT